MPENVAYYKTTEIMLKNKIDSFFVFLGIQLCCLKKKVTELQETRLSP